MGNNGSHLQPKLLILIRHPIAMFCT